MIYLFIKDHEKIYSIEKMCKVLKVSPSSYYNWKRHILSERQRKTALMKEEITSIYFNASIEDVWKVFSDVNNWSNWQKEISTSKINGSFKEGSSFEWKSNGLSIHSTLNSVETNKKVAWSGPAFGAFAIHTWSFRSVNGKTLVEVNESMEGWLVNLFKSKFQLGLDTSIERWLNDLKSESEKK
jgi:hypothetical protein